MYCHAGAARRYTDFIPSGSGDQAGGVRALRALRALRPLRTITRFDSLRSIVVCFLEVGGRACWLYCPAVLCQRVCAPRLLGMLCCGVAVHFSGSTRALAGQRAPLRPALRRRYRCC